MTEPGPARAWAGCLHSRGVPLAIALTLLAHFAVFFGWESVIGIDLAWDKPARGVGVVEWVGLLLAASLPAVLVPSLEHELSRGRRTRYVSIIIAASAVAAVLSLLITWAAALRLHLPPAETPPVRGLTGNLMLACTIGWLSVLGLGRLWGHVATMCAAAGLLIAQQRWPDNAVSLHFASGAHWHTDWWLTPSLACVVLGVTWATRGVPVRRIID